MKVVASYPSDSPGYTHFVLDVSFEGEVVADVDGLTYGYTGPPDVQGTPTHERGDAVPTVSATINGGRDFELAGDVKKLTFSDGTTWSPAANPAPTEGV